MKLSSWLVKTLALLTLSSCVVDRAFLARAEESSDATETTTTATADSETETETATPYEPPAGAEHFKFEAEVHKMLDIVVNSLYQHNDVFLRELISNASDALDKIRYLMLSDPERYAVTAKDLPLEVKIEYDADAKTLTIRDTGVGMTHDEMVENLGTVARSGTTKFIQALKDSGNADDTMSQIGQFGVGFYSAFLVADRVTVASKNPTDPVQHIWESNNGAAEFVVYADPRGNTMERGTEITLHLKEECLEYTEERRITDLAHHYSEFVVHPIALRKVQTHQVEIKDDEEDEFADETKKIDDDELDVSDDEDEDAGAVKEKPKKTKEVTSYSWEVINGNQAIWTRDKDEITDEEYQAFYKQLSGDTKNATEWSHFLAEGNINFKSILYLPEDPPAHYAMGNLDAEKGALKLYVRKVLIGDDFDLLPRYLGFIRGIVDSDDLQLNVNRETLQESKILTVIRKKVVRKAIDLIRQLAKDSEAEEAKEEEDADKDGEGDDETDKTKEREDSNYIKWYKKFAANIKLGILEDYPNRSKLTKLLRFATSKSNGSMIPLSQYIENMKEWQKHIYILGCSSTNECETSPFLEPFKEKDVEVVFMTDAIDEYMVKEMRDYDGKKLMRVSAENARFHDDDEDLIKRREKVYDAKFKGLVQWLRKLYEGTVLRVQVAKRPLGSVPAIVSSSEYGNSANMERIMKAQAFGSDVSGQFALKIFEINPRHPLILKLLENMPDDTEDKDAKASPEVIDAAWMLHDMAMLNGGFPLHDPDAHNKRLMKVMQSQFSIESLQLEPEINPPVEEDVPPETDDEFNFDSINNGQGLPEGITPDQMAKIMQQLNEEKGDASESEQEAESTEKETNGGLGDEL